MQPFRTSWSDRSEKNDGRWPSKGWDKAKTTPDWILGVLSHVRFAYSVMWSLFIIRWCLQFLILWICVQNLISCFEWIASLGRYDRCFRLKRNEVLSTWLTHQLTRKHKENKKSEVSIFLIQKIKKKQWSTAWVKDGKRNTKASRTQSVRAQQFARSRHPIVRDSWYQPITILVRLAPSTVLHSSVSIAWKSSGHVGAVSGLMLAAFQN
jgi:hypothetical protein